MDDKQLRQARESHYRRRFAALFREFIAKDPDPSRPVIPVLLQIALWDARYWDRGRPFGFEPVSEGGPIGVRFTMRNDRGQQYQLVADVGAMTHVPDSARPRPARPGSMRPSMVDRLSRRDPVANERNVRRLARLLGEMITTSPYGDLSDIPAVLEAALDEAGYWLIGREFGFKRHPVTGRMGVTVFLDGDDDMPVSVLRDATTGAFPDVATSRLPPSLAP